MIVTYEIFRPVIPAFGTWAVISSGSTESPVWTARIFADRITFGGFSVRKCKFRTASTICPGSTLEQGSHCNQIKYSLIYRPFCCKYLLTIMAPNHRAIINHRGSISYFFRSLLVVTCSQRHLTEIICITSQTIVVAISRQVAFQVAWSDFHYITENGLRRASGPVPSNIPSVTFISKNVNLIEIDFFCLQINSANSNMYPILPTPVPDL